MYSKWFDRFWHEFLRRPYRLAAPIVEGEGQTVVLLHGIASDHRAWGYVLPHISYGCRVIAPDLLGFGDSPNPARLEYTVQDHAQAVIATLKRLGVRRDAILVGHSMGGLVAVEVAKQRPRLAKRLILCSMPVYRFDAKRRLLPNQESIYARLYRQVQQEHVALRAFNSVKRLRPDLKGFGLNKKNLQPFQKSLANTIMKQTTFDDIQHLDAPVDLVCGRLDAFVIRRHLQTIATLLKGESVKFIYEPHEVTDRYGRIIAELINAAAEGRAPHLPATKRPARH